MRTLLSAYDGRNRLVRVGAGTQPPVTFAYDHEGRPLHVSQGGSTTHYLYTGSAIHSEYDATWLTPQVRYAHGPGIDFPLVHTTATGSHFYHRDGLGSLVAMSDRAARLRATARSDAWGQGLESIGSVICDPECDTVPGVPRFRYTGREPDTTGLHYYRAR
jgi:YD repeat-containing protein